MEKIIFYNIFEGCPKDEQSQMLIQFIQKEKPTLLGLSELNNWEHDSFSKLKNFCTKTGMPYYLFAKSKEHYHVGLFSKLPFKQHNIYEKNFKTGAIRAEIIMLNATLQIIVSHLHSDNEDKRLQELIFLTKNINLDKPSLFMGDMNSLSQRDNYNEATLLTILKKNNLKKFGTTKLRYEAIKKIEEWGFNDSFYLKNSQFQKTVPTLINDDYAHIAPLRLDYIFTTSDLKNSIKSASVIKTALTEKISDHYPVILELI